MSGSSRDTEIRLTADTSQLDASLAASAAAAQTAFQNMQSAGTQTASSVTASVGQMEKSLRTAQAQFLQLGGSAKEAIGQYIAALQSQIDAAKGSMAESSEAARSAAAVHAEVWSRAAALSGQALNSLVQSLTGVTMQTLSARDAAERMSSELEKTGVSAVRSTDRAYQEWRQTVGLTESRLLSSRTAAAELGSQVASLGTEVRSVSGAAFFDMHNKLLGIGQASRTAAEAQRDFAAAVRNAGDASAVTHRTLQQNINIMAGVGGQIKSASDSYNVFKNDLATVGDTLRGVDQAAEKTGRSIHGAGVLGSGALQELTRQTRALLTGNFELLPGETLTLISRMGQLSPAIYGVVGAMAALSLATVEAIRHFRELREARLQAEVGAASFNPQINREQANAAFEQAKSLANVFGLSKQAAGELSGTIVSTTGISAEGARFLLTAVRDLSGGVEERMPALARQLAEAYASPATSMRQLLGDYDSTGQAVKKFDSLVGDTADIERRVLFLRTMAEAAARVRERSSLPDTAVTDENIGRGLRNFGRRLLTGESTTGREAPLTTQAQETQILADRNRDLAAAIDTVTGRVRDRAAASGTWTEKMEAGLKVAQELSVQASETAGRSPQQTEVAKYQATVEYWQRVLTGETENNKQRLDAQRALSAANTQLTQARIREVAAEEASWTQVVTTELARRQANVDISSARETITQQQLNQKKLQLTVDYWKSVLEADNLSQKQRFFAEHAMATATIALRASQNQSIVTGARQGLREQIAALSAEQEANRQNYEVVIQLQNRKLDIIRKAAGEHSVLYQQELRRLSELENQGVNEQIQIALRSANTRASVARTETSERRSELQQQVAEYRLSYEDMMVALRQYTIAQSSSTLQEYDRLVAGLQEGTKAYARAMDERRKLAASLSRDVQRLDTEYSQHERESANRRTQVWVQSMSQITSSVAHSIQGLITRQMTWLDAVRNVARSAISSFTDMAGQWLSKWAATMLASTIIHNEQLAIQVAADQVAGATGWGSIIQWILKKLGVEQTATLAGVALKKTAAVSEISTDAGIAAAGAYAAMAGIPIIGPALAEAASMAALAQVMGYTSLVALDVGAWSVPKDMPAYIHQGEMVVPRNFASGLRDSLSGSGSAAGGAVAGPVQLNYSPTFHGGANTGSMRGMVRRTSREAARMLEGSLRNGALLVPGRGAGVVSA